MAMTTHWRETFRLWSQTYDYQNLLENTKKNIKKILENYSCYVAFSGGKDSTVLLHLALQGDQNIPIFHWDYGIFMPRKIENEIQQNLAKLGAKNVHIRKRISKSSDCKIGYQEFYDAIARLKRNLQLEIALIGLRKEESHRRACKIHQQPKGEFYPIADWKWVDVWAYIVSNDLPYSSIYDKYAELLGYDRARLVTFFDMEFEKFGSPYLDGFLLPQERNLPPESPEFAHRPYWWG